MKFNWLFVLAMLLLFAVGCSTEETQGDDSSDDENPETTTDGNDTGNEGTSEEENVTIRYATFSPGEAHEEDLKAMIAAFEDIHPNIKIEYEMAAFDDYFTRLQTQIAGNNAPDVLELNYENFVSYASRGALMDLTDLLAEDSEFDPTVLNQEAFKAFQYDGTQYGMVESFSNVVLFYNKELFDEAGVNYPDASWTWEDELKAAQDIMAHHDDVWGTFSPLQFWEFYKTIAQNGGGVFDDAGNIVLNSQENIEALQWMVDKIHEYGVTPSDEQMSGQEEADLFLDGKIAMLRTGIWMFGMFADAPFDWDIALEPGNTAKAHHFFANGLAISDKSEHAEAAWEWVKFMSASEEAASIRVAASWELPAITNEDVLSDYLSVTPPESREVVFDALDSLVTPPVVEEWSRMTDMIGEELELVKLKQKTPAEALESAEERLKNILN
ncbi:ABC transporter substrate-binding protein [Evansella tamaricis]|uniref:Sugar ABC transporter substrate-binding protein n=1 Tax=Evansella tamaricis TaxID=2069301 RepID=A0ABS6JKG9_9BACI|nr:sugar ABC transporter substrate-binding protein [Evansella tamaricis]MBU9713880.1 sugar ABC transporter substrate-binding protein [Evansella tamaricis]